MSPEAAINAIRISARREVFRVNTAVKMRMPRAANQLRNAELSVLANASPSAPGNPPGVRTGYLRRNWTMFHSATAFGIESAMEYSRYLEEGTTKMAARPYVDKVQEQALPGIRRIFGEIGG